MIDINLDELEPYVNGPFTPDLAWPDQQLFAAAVKENNWPERLEVALIGSCTNSSYEDISRSASLAQQAIDKNLKTKAEFTITPGSEQVRYTIEKDGFLETSRRSAASSWQTPQRTLYRAMGASYRRPHPQELDHHFLQPAISPSATTGWPPRMLLWPPEIPITAFAIAGHLSFNPLTDTLKNEKGEDVMLDEPKGVELPPKGFFREGCRLPGARQRRQERSGRRKTRFHPVAVTRTFCRLGRRRPQGAEAS